MRRPRHVIGWNECVDLPAWGIYGLPAKVDTGARTSSLDVDHVEELPGGRVRFNIVLSQRHRKKRIPVTTAISRISHVQASPIHAEHRIFVKTRVRLGPVTRTIELNLYDRSNMSYRMLLGRTALGRHFLVDVNHARLWGTSGRGKRLRK